MQRHAGGREASAAVPEEEGEELSVEKEHRRQHRGGDERDLRNAGVSDRVIQAMKDAR